MKDLINKIEALYSKNERYEYHRRVAIKNGDQSTAKAISRQMKVIKNQIKCLELRLEKIGE